MAELTVDILAPAKVLSRGNARQVLAPGAQGYLGILPGHTALVTELGIGELKVEGPKGDDLYFVAGGYLEVANDKVTVLVDIGEPVDQIDRDRAEKARLRALDRLQKATPDIDVARAQRALARAQARLAVLNHRSH